MRGETLRASTECILTRILTSGDAGRNDGIAEEEKKKTGSQSVSRHLMLQARDAMTILLCARYSSYWFRLYFISSVRSAEYRSHSKLSASLHLSSSLFGSMSRCTGRNVPVWLDQRKYSYGNFFTSCRS